MFYREILVKVKTLNAEMSVVEETKAHYLLLCTMYNCTVLRIISGNYIYTNNNSLVVFMHSMLYCVMTPKSTRNVKIYTQKNT